MVSFEDVISVFYSLFIKYNVSVGDTRIMQRIQDIVLGLENKIEDLEDLVNEEIEVIRFHVKNKDKSKAMVSIKKKKSYELQIKELNSKISSINYIISKMDQSLTDMEVLEAQKHTSNEIKKILGTSSTEKTESHIDNIEDQVKKIDEISLTISQNNLSFIFNDNDLDDEYNEFLEKEPSVSENMNEINVSKTTHSIPISEINIPTKTLPNLSNTSSKLFNKKVIIA